MENSGAVHLLVPSSCTRAGAVVAACRVGEAMRVVPQHPRPCASPVHSGCQLNAVAPQMGVEAAPKTQAVQVAAAVAPQLASGSAAQSVGQHVPAEHGCRTAPHIVHHQQQARERTATGHQLASFTFRRKGSPAGMDSRPASMPRSRLAFNTCNLHGCRGKQVVRAFALSGSASVSGPMWTQSLQNSSSLAARRTKLCARQMAAVRGRQRHTAGCKPNIALGQRRSVPGGRP